MSSDNGWEHRLVRTQEDGVERIAIHEVYYKGGKLWAHAVNPRRLDCFASDSEVQDWNDAEALRSLNWTLTQFQKALEKPILSDADFNFDAAEEAAEMSQDLKDECTNSWHDENHTAASKCPYCDTCDPK